MRFAPLLSLAPLTVLAAGPAIFATARADDAPTADEQKAIAAVAKLGGEATIDTDLAKEARVAVKFAAPTDVQLAALKKLPQVGAVTLADARKCSDRGLAGLKDLPHLRKLFLSQSVATNATAAAVGECKELRQLYLGQARITDAGLANLKKLSRLEMLDVTGNKGVTDAGMAHLKALERLEHLYLGDTAITDRGLAQLSNLEGLTRLNVAGTRVSAAAAEAFEQAMPNLRAVRR